MKELRPDSAVGNHKAMVLGADAVAYPPEAEGQADIRIVLGRDAQGP